MDNLEFFKHWESCKYLADSMQLALTKAKEKNPSIDYTEAENKIKILSDIQIYLGQLHERYTTLKEINLEHGEKYGKLKELYIKQAKELQALTNENKQLKESIK